MSSSKNYFSCKLKVDSFQLDPTTLIWGFFDAIILLESNIFITYYAKSYRVVRRIFTLLMDEFM